MSRVRITIACPTDDAQLHADASQFALAIGLSAADIRTFDAVGYEDAAGHRYSVASLRVPQSFFSEAKADLTERATQMGANLGAANRAQSVIDLWGPQYDQETGELVTQPPLARSGSLVVVVHPNPRAAVRLMGLTSIDRKE